MGDYYLAHTARSVAIPAPARTASVPEWALDGSSGGSGRAKLISFLGSAKQRDDVGYDLAVHYAACADAHRGHGRRGASRWPRSVGTDDAEVVVVAFGTPARYVRAAVRQLRAEGVRGRLRAADHPVPVPDRQRWPRAARGARAVAVYENNQGQMIDDVRLAVLGPGPGALHRRPQPGQLRLRHRPRPRRRA